MSTLFAGVIVGAFLYGLFLFSLEAYGRFVTARAHGRSGIGAFAVYFVCGTVSLWVAGTITYYAIASL